MNQKVATCLNSNANDMKHVVNVVGKNVLFSMLGDYNITEPPRTCSMIFLNDTINLVHKINSKIIK